MACWFRHKPVTGSIHIPQVYPAKPGRLSEGAF